MSTEPAITDGAGYTPREGFLDEVFAPDGAVAPYAAELVAALDRLGPDGLAEAGRRRDAIFLQQGITFELTGEDGPQRPAASRSTSCRGSSRPPSGGSSSAASRSASAR